MLHGSLNFSLMFFGRSECDDVCSAPAAMFISNCNVYYYYSLAWHTDVVELPLIQHLNTGLETLRDTAAAASCLRAAS
jgi:hypothetical protein